MEALIVLMVLIVSQSVNGQSAQESAPLEDRPAVYLQEAVPFQSTSPALIKGSRSNVQTNFSSH